MLFTDLLIQDVIRAVLKISSNKKNGSGNILVKITDRMFSISLTEKLPIPRKVDFDCFEINDQAFPFPFKMADQ